MKSRMLMLLCIVAASATYAIQSASVTAGSAAAGQDTAKGIVVNFAPAAMSTGPVQAWTNSGSMGGVFTAVGSAPQVQVINGKKILVFDGSSLLRSSVPAPASITGSNGWSVEVWAFQHDIGARGSTMVSWAPRDGEAGRTAQFTWSADGLAAVHWGMDMPWKNKPRPSAWYHIVYTFADGTEIVYVNGAEDQRQRNPIAIAAARPVLIGAVETKGAPISHFCGALGMVRIYDHALSAESIAKKYTQEKDAMPAMPVMAPAIANDVPAGIRPDSAYVNGRLAATGGAETKGFLYWGTTDGGTRIDGWEHCEKLGTMPVGDLARKLTGLKSGTRYYYRYYAVNAATSDWADTTTSVTTRPPRAKDDTSFRIVVMPDSQNAMEAWPEVIKAMSLWIVTNRDAMQIKYVLHMGDITNVGNDEEQWKRASDSLRPLDGVVPFILTPGNHDYDRVDKDTRLGYFNRYFPVSKFKAYPGFGGSLPTNTNNNSYHTFEAGGRKWLIVALEFNPSDAELEWANKIVAAHPGHTVLVMTHSYLTHQGKDASGENIWKKFAKRHANISAVFCGHLTTVHYQDKGDSGNKVCEMLFDWQNPTGPEMNSYFALLEINPAARTMTVECYSPWLDRFLPGPNANIEYTDVTVVGGK